MGQKKSWSVLLNQGIEHTGFSVGFKKTGQSVKDMVQGAGLGTKERLQNSRVFEQAMQIAAQHVARSVLPTQAGHDFAGQIACQSHGRVLRGLSVVNFIARSDQTRQGLPWAGHIGKSRLGSRDCFEGVEHRDQGQQAQARRIAVDAVGVDQRLAQHLQATADTQHRPALRGMCGHRAVESLRPQPGQIGRGGTLRGQAVRAGFSPLAGYIFARERSGEKIAMTAPVTVAPQSSKIAMTAPVTLEPQTASVAGAKAWRVHFVMPSQYTMATLPKPLDPQVELREIPAKTYAALTYTGQLRAADFVTGTKAADAIAAVKAEALNAFGDDRVTVDRIAKALATFQRSLRRLREHTGLDPMLIMSGGAVSRLGHDVIEWPAFVVENLIFEGLLTLASAIKE